MESSYFTQFSFVQVVTFSQKRASRWEKFLKNNKGLCCTFIRELRVGKYINIFSLFQTITYTTLSRLLKYPKKCLDFFVCLLDEWIAKKCKTFFFHDGFLR